VSLRMVELMLPSKAADELRAMKADLRLIELWQEALDDEMILVRVLVQSDQAEAVMQAFEGRFAGQAGFRMLLIEVEATVPPPVIEEDVGEQDRPRDPQRIACAELVERLASGTVANRVFFATVVLSTVVATIGLVRDNLAVIIGAMVIAPLLNPNITLSLATTLGDGKLARQALLVNVAGVGLAFLLALVMGLLIPVDTAVSEIAGRTQVGLSDVVLALAAGSAGALAVTSGVSAALVGVMVAVALLPPLAVTGLLFGAGDFALSGGAALLTAVNVICVNLAGVATFLWQGVWPQRWWEAKRARRMVRIAAIVWLLLLLCLVLLIQLAQE